MSETEQPIQKEGRFDRIELFIVWAKGRMAYDEQDSIDSIFYDKKECQEYVKKENDNCRSYSEYYWDDYRIKNPYKKELESLVEWYESFKKPQITKDGDTFARFMIEEMERRFPFLKTTVTNGSLDKEKRLS